jgi:hypothetical protein
VHELDPLRRHENNARERQAASHGEHGDAVRPEADLLDDPRGASEAFDAKPDAVAKPVPPDGAFRAERALVLQRHRREDANSAGRHAPFLIRP